jgi:hypothetical protein
MIPAVHPEPSHVTDAETDAALKQYGIVKVPAHNFEYGGYRYTNIKDAIAEAKRHMARGQGRQS